MPSSNQSSTDQADDVTISITVDARTAAYLRALTRSISVPRGTLEDVLAHLAHSAADGLRRPGAWERGWVEQAFGDVNEGPQTPGVRYAHLEPWQPTRIDEIDVRDDVPCESCGGTVEARLVDAGGDRFAASWACLGCVTDGEGLAELAAEPDDIAVASLLAFVHRCCTERAYRPRCGDCGRAKGGHLVEQVVEADEPPWLVCAECLAEHVRDFPQGGTT